jgi:hypothetical protein
MYDIIITSSYLAMSESESSRDKKSTLETFIQLTGKNLRNNINRNKVEFSEKIEIKPNGSLQVKDEKGRTRLFFAQCAVLYTRSDDIEALYKYAYQVHEKFPELQFAFDRDKEGKSITFTVSMTEKFP